MEIQVNSVTDLPFAGEYFIKFSLILKKQSISCEENAGRESSIRKTDECSPRLEFSLMDLMSKGENSNGI